MTAAALLTFTLSATMPTQNAGGNGLCIDIASCIVYRAVQSQTYLANEAFLRGPGFATARGDSIWRIVRAEAEPVQVASVGLGWPDAGTLKSFTLPDSLRGSFVMRTRDTSLNESGDSNWSSR